MAYTIIATWSRSFRKAVKRPCINKSSSVLSLMSKTKHQKKKAYFYLWSSTPACSVLGSRLYLRTRIWFMYFGLALHFQISLQRARAIPLTQAQKWIKERVRATFEVLCYEYGIMSLKLLGLNCRVQNNSLKTLYYLRNRLWLDFLCRVHQIPV